MYSSIETIIYGDIALKRIWWCRKCWHECSLGVYLVIKILGGYRASFGWKQLCWECQISIALILGGIYPHIKLYYNVLELACHFKVISDGHTHTDRQPQYNSFVTDSRLNYKVGSEFVLCIEKNILAHYDLRKTIWLIIDWKKIFWPWKWEKKILWLVASLKTPALPPPPGSLVVAP